MISTYDDYLPMSMSLSLEEMASLHNDIVKEIGNDSDSLELFEELITTATRYMVFRSNWLLWSKEKKMDKDSSRTSCHNSLIVKFNQLARYLKSQGRLPPGVIPWDMRKIINISVNGSVTLPATWYLSTASLPGRKFEIREGTAGSRRWFLPFS